MIYDVTMIGAYNVTYTFFMFVSVTSYKLINHTYLIGSESEIKLNQTHFRRRNLSREQQCKQTEQGGVMVYGLLSDD